jgi:hypothetical protein
MPPGLRADFEVAFAIRACFSALVKAMDAVPGALQSVTGNLKCRSQQAQGVGVIARGRPPEEKGKS